MANNQHSSTIEPARILLVDDHPTVREGIAALIGRQSDLAICGEAAGVQEALRLVDEQSPNLVVVDLSLRDGHGLDLTKRIKLLNADIKVLIHSMYDESFYAERALQAGASGYVNKHANPQTLLEAIRDVLKGRVYFTAAVLDRMTGRSSAGTPKPLGLAIETLTDRELQVFELIGEGLTSRAIASRLDLSMHTIDTHREKIKAKLKLKNAAELTRHAVQWVLERG
jgi:DNA-binding NarL/FixJ family response regulator